MRPTIRRVHEIASAIASTRNRDAGVRNTRSAYELREPPGIGPRRPALSPAGRPDAGSRRRHGSRGTALPVQYICIGLMEIGRRAVTRGRGRDHDAVRQAIIDAAGTTVEQGGVESLTFRRVAATARVSPGRIQHYFTDRASLVQACFDAVQDRARSRVEAALAAGGPSAAEVGSAVLHTMIPR